MDVSDQRKCEFIWGCAIKTFVADPGWQLEQWCECGCVLFELEQPSLQFQQQHWFPLRSALMLANASSQGMQHIMEAKGAHLHSKSRKKRGCGGCRNATHRKNYMKQITEGAFEEIACFENLYEAYLEARKGRRARPDVGVYSYNLEDNLIQTEKELLQQTYEVGPYHRFFVREPKKRLVMSLQFRDRVVQWAIYKKLMPFYDKQFIEDSYACRIGKGSHQASNKLQYWLRQVHRKPCKWYYLKLDISKYFYRVDHEKLLEILGRRVTDPKLMWLLEKIINSREPFGLPPGVGPDEIPREEWLHSTGMPIGNLTSQLFANIYLNELDQYCKHVLHIKYYVRYMDDIIILGADKKELHELKDKIKAFLKEELRLDLNNKTAIRPVDTGIEFVGFRTWGTYKRIKKQTAKRMKRAVKHLTMLLATEQITREHFDRCMASYAGILKQAKADGLKARLNEIYMETMRQYRKEVSVSGKQNNFKCSHEAQGICKRTLEECSQECKAYGQCGECELYYIPAGQEPCSGCLFLCVDEPKVHQEGEKEH